MKIRWNSLGMPAGERYAKVGGIDIRIIELPGVGFKLQRSSGGVWKGANEVFYCDNVPFDTLNAALLGAYYLRYKWYRWLCDEVGVMPAPMPPLPDEKWVGRGLLDLAKQARRYFQMMQEWQPDTLNEVTCTRIERNMAERMAALLEWRAGRAVNREHDERIIGVGSDGLPNYSGGGPVDLDHIPF